MDSSALATDLLALYQDRVVLVTGGASGIGKACVERFATLGAHVVIADLPTSEGAKNIRATVDFIPTDVTSEAEVKRLIDHVQSKYDRLDLVINSAGIQFASSPVYDFVKDKPQSLEVFNRLIQVNLTGTFNVIRLAVGLMAKNKPEGADGHRGLILNISSIASFDAPAGRVAYVASKAAVSGMTLALSREFGEKGIRVVAIAPGAVDTPMLGDFDVKKETMTNVFPKRCITPDEIAHLIQSVMDNKMINGDVIRIDGGCRMPFTG